MAGEVPAATATTAPPVPELAWSPSTMTDADIEALVAQGLLPEKAISGWRSCTREAFYTEDRMETVGFLGIAPHFNLWRALYHLRAYPNKDIRNVVDSAAFSLRQGGRYPEAIFKNSNKRWAGEWFVVANPAPGLPSRTGLPPVLNAKWVEKPNEEGMVEVEVLLAEMQKLKAEKLTGAALALSFVKRLTQPIQERVHPGYEYSGREDPTRGQNRKVSRSEAHWRATLIVSGEVHDKGCPKAYCLKRPTTELLAEKIVSFWCPTPPPEGQQGKAVDPPAGLALPAADVGSFSSDSSIGSESDDVAEVSGPAAVDESTCRRVSLSGAKRKAEVSTHEASSAEVAKGELSPAERPLARPRLIERPAAKTEEAKGEAAESEPSQVVQELPEEETPGEALLEAAQRAAEVTQALADLSRRAASQLEEGDGLASRVLQLEEELQVLKWQHSKASKKQSAKRKELKMANETMARERKAIVAANGELHRLREGAEG
ncbi:retrotransposon protein, putative, unclassified [Panicum miliaceum]|uniref:Retrotransposon protein, putative, unclassified n=1 Tax=Panicum miliaceum TaxID=4540 RepID=A0A3L6RYW6_PANMI|nr:retrotransposon protein, putative, unclassified [Panicum miliaceum]